MSPREIKVIPEPSLRRLPRYHRYLRTEAERGRAIVSCTHIALELRLDPTQVRKDLAYTGIAGKPKVGYEVPALIQAIEVFLGWDAVTDAVLVGAGSLGAALLGYEGFRQHNLNLIAAFDVNPTKVGRTVHDVLVRPLEDLTDLVRREHVHLGIIATPAEAAQDVADRLVAGGIQAIWNFAPASLTLPEGVILENQQLSIGLAVLSARRREKQLRESAAAEENA
ncbi:MAG TPA: redox-sensing transcriptional repressor Rex [Armatimonadota bacterium]|jgi:redox-sensing transcriptional repressor